MPVQPNTSPVSTSGFDPAQLADIHLPGEISHWPTAPGWWMSAIIIIVLISIAWAWKKKRDNNPDVINNRRLKRLKTEAQKELETIKKIYREHHDGHQAVEQLSVFLRRFALSVYERKAVASLTDEQWLNLLDTLSGSQQFSETFRQLLTEAPYQSPDKPVDTQLMNQLFSAVEKLLDTTNTKALPGGSNV